MKDYLYRTFLSSKKYVRYLRRLGCKVGEDVSLYQPINTITIDITRPWLISIGDHVRITKGVTILTHDYGWSVIKGISGEVIGSAREVRIGNNVFIGVNTVILKGTTIEDHVIIGAGSIVSGHLEAESVYGGVPCRKLMTLEAYYEKRRSKAKEEYLEIMKRMNEKNASKEEILRATREYFWLYADRKAELPQDVKALIGRTGYQEKVLEAFYQSEKTNNM